MPEKLPQRNKQPGETGITFTPQELLSALKKMLEDKQLNSEERKDIAARMDGLEKSMKNEEKGG